MRTLKKISPLEFRINNRLFFSDFTPINYFEKFRFEIILHRMLFWFFRSFGIYIMVKQMRIIEDKVVLQFYYYRTYINRIPRRRRRARVRKIRRSRYLSSFEINTLLNFQLNTNEEAAGIPASLSIEKSRLAVSAILVKKEFIPSRFLENRLPILVNKYRYKKFLSMGQVVIKGLVNY
jgi:hypothetical protein